MENKIKRFLSLVFALVMVFSMMPQLTLSAKAEEAKTIYLNAGGSGLWDQANAWFFVHAWDPSNTSNSQDVRMEKYGTTGLYKAEINPAYTKLLFARKNPENQSVDWDNVWNQTTDLTVSGNNNCYTIEGWGESEGSWSHECVPGEAATCYTAQTCTVCGKELSPATAHNWSGDNNFCTSCGRPKVIYLDLPGSPNQDVVYVSFDDDILQSMTLVEESKYLKRVYSCVLPENAKTIVFEFTQSIEESNMYTSSSQSAALAGKDTFVAVFEYDYENSSAVLDGEWKKFCPHTNVTETTKDATCTEDGSTVVTCNDCGEELVNQPHYAGHKFTDGKCNVCGRSQKIYVKNNSDVLICACLKWSYEYVNVDSGEDDELTLGAQDTQILVRSLEEDDLRDFTEDIPTDGRNLLTVSTDSGELTGAWSTCGDETTPHAWGDDSVCDTCGMTCAHTPGAAATCFTDQVCTSCGKVLHVAPGSHAYDGASIFCTNCGLASKVYIVNLTGDKISVIRSGLLHNGWEENTTAEEVENGVFLGSSTTYYDGYKFQVGENVYEAPKNGENFILTVTATDAAWGVDTHSFHNMDGTCQICNQEVGHKFVDGKCTDCGTCQEHSWNGGKNCTECGYWCDHTYVDGKCACGAAEPKFESYVVMPEGITAVNVDEKFGTNTVTDGTNYYATLQAAVEAVSTKGGTLYCKPGADVGSLQHAPVCSTLTIYGNGASVTGGAERDFDIGNTDPSGGKDITADMTLTVKYLNGCGAWGAKATEHTVNLVFENCENMGKVFITGTTGTLNITMTDCTFEGVIKEAVYSNADGAISLTRVDFSNLNKAINLNHRAAGTQTVELNGCTFTDCGADVAQDQIPVRVLSSVEGGTSTLTVSGCSFSGTPEGGADILLDKGVGTTTAAISSTAANVTVEQEDNTIKTTTTVEDDKSFSNVCEHKSHNTDGICTDCGATVEHSFVDGKCTCGVKAVAYIGTQGYESLQAAINAAAAMTGDVTIEILAGTYAENLLITNAAIGNTDSRPNITFKPAQGAEVVLAGTVTVGYYEKRVGNSNWNGAVAFENITFDHAESGKHSLDVQEVKDFSLTGCTIVGDGEYGISGTNVHNGPSITGCTFTNAAIQSAGSFGTNLVIDDCTFNNSRINIQSGNLVTVQNSIFNSTLNATGDFYIIRSNDNEIVVEDCEINVDSALAADAAPAEGKAWAIFWQRNVGSRKWNMTDIEVNYTDAALAQTELLLNKNATTNEANKESRVTITNLTSTSNDVAQLIAKTESYLYIVEEEGGDPIRFEDGVLDYEAQITVDGKTSYCDTLADALVAAKNGDTVTLIVNLELAAYIEVPSGVTLTAAEDVVITLKEGTMKSSEPGVIVLKDGAILNGVTIQMPATSTELNAVYMRSNSTVQNCTVIGVKKYEGGNEVTRAIMTMSGATNIEISGNTFKDVRQPAYVNGSVTGTIKENSLEGAEGWIIAHNSDMNIIGNTFGDNYVADIAIIDNGAGADNYAGKTVELSKNNNNAMVENFVEKTAMDDGKLVVKGEFVATGDLTGVEEIVLADPNATVKNDSDKELNVTTTLESDYVDYSNGAYRVVDIKVNVNNLTLENSLAMNFWIRESDLNENAADYKVVMNGPSGEVTATLGNTFKYDGVDYYQVSYPGLAAKQMNEVVTIEIQDAAGNVVSNLWGDSIRGYAEYMLAQNGTSTELKTALVDMLNYGAAAQVEFKDQSEPANAGLTAEQKSWASQSYADLADNWNGGSIGYGSNLELKQNIILHIWFKNVGITHAEVSFTDHYGIEVTDTVYADKFTSRIGTSIMSVAVDELVVADGRQVVTVVFYNGNTEVGTVKESVASYINYMKEKDAGNELYEMTIKFVDSAKAYFDSSIG